MTGSIFDVVVLGGGPGGVAAAIRASQLGGKVAIVEKNDLGGLCMNRACVPFGHSMAVAGILKDLTLAREMGVTCSGVQADYAKTKKRQDALVAFMRQGVAAMLRKNQVELIRGQGTVTGPQTLDVGGTPVSFGKLILATGGNWVLPGIPQSDSGSIINSGDLLRMDELPRRAVLFGESPWKIQLAQFLHFFGSEVTLIADEKTLLPGESKAISARLMKALRNDGLTIKTECSIKAVERNGDDLKVNLQANGDSEDLIVDRVISLTRGVTTHGLGLECLGLESSVGAVRVNSKMETGAPGVYAVGDITKPALLQYSHGASEEGIAAAENAMGREVHIDPSARPRVLFTRPEVACVGLTGKQAKESGYGVALGAAPLSMNALGMIMKENEGLVEVVADQGSGRILGVHIVGRGAHEIIGQGVLAIRMGTDLEQLAAAPFPHPSLSESLAEAARDALGRPIYLP